MGLFSKPEPAPVGLPRITQERMKSLFDVEKWNYFVDNEGDLGGIWDGNQFFFLLRGEDEEILHITARWHGTVPFEKLEQVRDVTNAWNREKLWPKTFHRIGDDGQISIMAEHSTDFEHGATDEQLMQSIHCALGTSTRFFEMFNAEFAG